MSTPHDSGACNFPEPAAETFELDIPPAPRFAANHWPLAVEEYKPPMNFPQADGYGTNPGDILWASPRCPVSYSTPFPRRQVRAENIHAMNLPGFLLLDEGFTAQPLEFDFNAEGEVGK